MIKVVIGTHKKEHQTSNVEELLGKDDIEQKSYGECVKGGSEEGRKGPPGREDSTCKAEPSVNSGKRDPQGWMELDPRRGYKTLD